MATQFNFDKMDDLLYLCSDFQKEKWLWLHILVQLYSFHSFPVWCETNQIYLNNFYTTLLFFVNWNMYEKI